MGKKGTLVNKILRALGWMVLLGFVVALLRAFDFDPFGIIDWVFGLTGRIIGAIADFFSGNTYFQALTNRPK